MKFSYLVNVEPCLAKLIFKFFVAPMFFMHRKFQIDCMLRVILSMCCSKLRLIYFFYKHIKVLFVVDPVIGQLCILVLHLPISTALILKCPLTILYTNWSQGGFPPPLWCMCVYILGVCVEWFESYLSPLLKVSVGASIWRIQLDYGKNWAD